MKNARLDARLIERVGPALKKLLINFAKLAISLGIIVYLVVDVRRNNPDLFATFLEGPKQWPLLATAFVLILGAVSLSFVRWYFLVRALRLPFSKQISWRDRERNIST